MATIKYLNPKKTVSWNRTYCTFRPGSRLTQPRLHSSKETMRNRKVYHLIAILEVGKRHLCHSILFVGRLLCGEERRVSRQGEVDTGEAVRTHSMNPIARRQNEHSRDEVGLKLIQVDIERAIQAEASGDKRDDLRNQPGCATLRRFLQIS